MRGLLILGIEIQELFLQRPLILLETMLRGYMAMALGGSEALEITVEGAALGDFVLSSLSIDLTDLSLSGAVTAADTVTLVLSNNSGGSINLGAAVAYCMVIKKP